MLQVPEMIDPQLSRCVVTGKWMLVTEDTR